MLDPVAVRSYLGSLGQQGGGQGGGGVQARLANLRQRLYGQQALQGGGMNQTPGINPGLNKPDAGQPDMGGKPTLSGPMAQTPGINPGAQAPGKPAWQVMREAGQQPLGSAAANRAAAAKLPGGQPFGGVEQSYGAVQGPPMGRVPQGLRDVLQANAGQLGGLPDQGFPAGGPTGGTFGELPLQQPGGLGGPGSDIGYQVTAGGDGNVNPGSYSFQSGGGLMGFPGNGGFGDGAGQPQLQSGGGLQAPPADPAVKPPAPGRPASPAVLGADQFRGPNRQRIVNARQGIFNNVQQALRKPPQRPMAGGGKVGMR